MMGILCYDVHAGLPPKMMNEFVVNPLYHFVGLEALFLLPIYCALTKFCKAHAKSTNPHPKQARIKYDVSPALFVRLVIFAIAYLPKNWGRDSLPLLVPN